MAKNKDNPQKQSIAKNILRQLGILQDRMDSVYKDTYSANPQNNRDLEKITNDIEGNISNIMARNSSNVDISQISRLYTAAQLKNAVNDKEYINSITDFFENKQVTDSIMATYSQNKWIEELDMELDTICKYMPSMAEGLDAIKDAVLSADNFEKEFLTFTSLDTNPVDQSKFNEEIKSYKKLYNLEARVEEWYENTAKYGETFIYKVPYSKAIAKLQDRKGNTKMNNIGYREATLITEAGGIPKSIRNDKSLEADFNSFRNLNLDHLKNLRVEICKDGAPLQSALTEATHLREALPVAESMSIMESQQTMEKLIPDKLEIPKELDDSTAADGIVDPNKPEHKSNIKVPGLLLKKLKHGNVILLYIDDICLGYYYLEFLNSYEQGMGTIASDTVFRKNALGGIQGNVKAQDQDASNKAIDGLLRYLSSMIIQNLDDKFINDNPSMRDAIYSILRYNDIYNSEGLSAIRVTYIPPDDMMHMKFKQDPDTHRGISDLSRSLIPAKLWVCLSTAINLGILTRGQDKRVYYVKQNVETNIAQTLLTVINQIKKNNFNIMQIENMNSILNITGKYNDYVIPVGPSGDSPVQMEVMQGQDINPQSEMLDKLEETAVNGIGGGVPLDLIKSRLSLDFASQLTMSNTKFLRFVYKRQSQEEDFIGQMMSDIYNAEHFNENGQKKVIKCMLPSPMLLNLNNLNQIMDLVDQQAERLSTYEYMNTNDENNELKKAIFKRNYVRYKLGGYIKMDEIEAIKNRTDLDFAKIAKLEDPLS